MLRPRFHGALGAEHAGDHRSIRRGIGEHADDLALVDGGAQPFVVGDLRAGGEVRQRFGHGLVAGADAARIAAVAQFGQAQFQQALLGVVLGGVGDGDGIDAAAGAVEQVDEGIRLILGKAVIEELFRVVPLLGRLVGFPARAQHHGNEGNAVALERAHEALPGAAVVAGFDADAALIIVGAGGVDHCRAGGDFIGPAVDRGGHRVGGRGDDLAENLVLHGHLGDEGEVVGGGIVRLVVIAVRVGKVRAGAADFGGAVVHHGHKFGYAAAHQVGDGVGAVVAGAEHGAVKQVLERHLFAGVDGHLGTVRRYVLRYVGDGDFLLQGDVAFHGQQERHDFCGAGGVHARQRILVKEHVAGFGVDKHGGLRVQVGGQKRAGVVFIPIRRGGIGLRREAGKQREQDKKERDRPATHGKFSFVAVFRRRWRRHMGILYHLRPPFVQHYEKF